jgi:antitoxin (DNA-binding transcriptional repressor) of toxin-antitoxin stability system
MKTLTVTEAARNLTDCVERVFRQRESFELVRNGEPRAHLVPVSGTGCTTHDLADDLAGTQLSVGDRRALRLAIRKGRQRLKPLK